MILFFNFYLRNHSRHIFSSLSHFYLLFYHHPLIFPSLSLIKNKNHIPKTKMLPTWPKQLCSLWWVTNHSCKITCPQSWVCLSQPRAVLYCATEAGRSSRLLWGNNFKIFYLQYMFCCYDYWFINGVYVVFSILLCFVNIVCDCFEGHACDLGIWRFLYVLAGLSRIILTGIFFWCT